MKKLILGLLLGLICFGITGCGTKTILISEFGEELKTIEPMDIHWVDDKEDTFIWKDPSSLKNLKYPLLKAIPEDVCADTYYDPSNILISSLFLPTDIAALFAGIPGSGANFGIVGGETKCEKGSPLKTVIKFYVVKTYGRLAETTFNVECSSIDKKLLNDNDCYKLTKAFLKKWNPNAKEQRLSPEI